MTGRVHSIETLGALDGPGLRCVVFLQGCPLRCRYCHNPDTWAPEGGQVVESDQIVARVLRYQAYFGKHGGVTLSGGEPLLQAAFCAEIFAGCKGAEIHTALDTSGYRLDDEVRHCLDLTDLVILDIKHTDPRKHRELTGCELDKPLAFLSTVASRNIPLWVRQVIVPGWNDTADQVRLLGELLAGIPSLRRAQLLPYHAMARAKWEALGRIYPLGDTPAPTPELMQFLQKQLDECIGK